LDREGTDEVVAALLVVMVIVLVSAASVVLLASNSTSDGLKEQEDSSGRPEQESVTNTGDDNVELLAGVTETVTVPESPGVRESVAGETDSE
jgi:hypothetical protein